MPCKDHKYWPRDSIDYKHRINFVGEFRVLSSAPTAGQLKRGMKNEELEQYGEPFIPEFVYDAIKQLSRFSEMKV
jgi:ubiquitin carboxyl-terminal hydrolase 10